MGLAPKVLITGTTSGIGAALLAHYAARENAITAVNRREEPGMQARFPRAHFARLDISSYEAVRDFLSAQGCAAPAPWLFFLNAGINKPDNLDGGFDYAIFREVMETNLAGVMTFVAAARALGIRSARFVGISSVSNLVPNPGHLGYHLSKWGIKRGFELLQARDGENLYKAVVLGPVHTRIARDFGGPTGWQGKIFDWLAPDVGEAARAIARFAEGRGRVLTYPLRARLFYRMAQLGLKAAPGLYTGTAHGDSGIGPLAEQNQ